jgi:hypothetical protein
MVFHFLSHTIRVSKKLTRGHSMTRRQIMLHAQVESTSNWEAVDGRWQMADGRWQMVDGRWQMADGRWQMADGRW